MKKTLSIILAVMMLLGCLSVTAFATESDGTWSYDPNTNTFTVNCTIPKKATLNTAIPEEVSITSTGEITGISGLFALWGKTCEENGYLYGSRNWMPAINRDDPDAVFKANTEYGYIIGVAHDPSVLQNDLAVAKIVLNGKEYSNVGYAKISDTYAEMFIVVDFGVLGADGNFTGGDFAETESGNKSGNTDITLTVAKSLTYDMVIPADVTNLNAAGIYSVGQAKVANVKNATDKTVISYTAETTAFKCEGKSDIPASYYTDEAGQNTFPTTAVEVYKSKADAASIPTMYVGISESAWNAAENGTYTATVTFNFSAEEVEKVTIADILPDEFPTEALSSNWSNNMACNLWVANGNLNAKGGWETSVPVSTELTLVGDKYTCTTDTDVWTFTMDGESFCKATISDSTVDFELNGDYTQAK